MSSDAMPSIVGLLAPYDTARAALAAALQSTEFSVVNASRIELDHLKLQARRVRDRALLADATEFQMKVERWLGVLLERAEAEGLLAGKGRQKKPGEGAVRPATLAEIGIDPKLSMTARRAADLDQDTFDAAIAAMRAKMASGKAITVGADIVAGSRAIMSSRIEPDDSLDFFPTPPWATRALVEHVLSRLKSFAELAQCWAWEPACGEGHIAEVLSEYFADVFATDIFDYGYGRLADFLEVGEVADLLGGEAHTVDWIITNPPFAEKSEAFVLRALERAKIGVAMFVRLQWLETVGRYESIFRDLPPTVIAFFAERVPLCKGRWDPEGDTATAYIWLVWVKDKTPQPPFWIAPGCREQLTRPDDAERFTQRPVARRSFVDTATGATSSSSPARAAGEMSA